MIDFSGVSMPFNVSDLLDSSMGLVGLLGPFVLLLLAVMFAPKFINLIRDCIYTYQDNKINRGLGEKYRQSYRDTIKQSLFEK